MDPPAAFASTFAPTASREGAFSTNDPAPAHITISSRRWAKDDWTSAEMLFHESSNPLALPRSGVRG